MNCGSCLETEWVEFKEANDDYDFRKLGKYFSALANEANLKNQPCGWLVFGVVNKDRSLCGSQYRENPAELDSLKHELAKQTTGGITFLDIHVVQHPAGRVVMFQIPPALPGVPVAFDVRGRWRYELFKRRSATHCTACEREPGVETPGYRRASLREGRRRAARPDDPVRSDNKCGRFGFCRGAALDGSPAFQGRVECPTMAFVA